MSKLYEAYQKIREEYPKETLVAFQIGDAFEFFNEDADAVAEILGVEVGMRAIGKSHRVPMVQVPMGTANKTFESILENGLTVAVCEQVFEADGETVALEQKELPAEEDEPDLHGTYALSRVVQPPADVEPVGGETTCVRCGKPLSTDDSVERGMGDVCAHQHKLLGEKTLEEHYDDLNLPELTDEWIPISELIAAGNEAGIATYRMVTACGGDRALRRPVHPSFQVKYFLRKRYVHKSALENVEAARLK